MEPIALISLSCLFPGAKTPEEFWQNLNLGLDQTSQAGFEELGLDPLAFQADKKGVVDRYYNRRGGYIRDFTFDPEGYQVPANTIQDLDRADQWPLYCAREALKDAGLLQNKKALERCGVILGNLSFPTRSSNRLALPLYLASRQEILQKLLDTPDLKLTQALPGPSKNPRST